jgi:hypothetical protein
MRLTKQQSRRKGAIVVYAAICMTALVGLSALTIDIGYQHDRLRHQQGAADAAALAAAGNLFKNWLNYNGGNLTNHAKAAATAIATKNGYTDGANAATVTVNSPPSSGLFTNTNDGAIYVEVIITQQESQFFSKIFGSTTLQTTARAVSRAAYSEVGDGIIVLDRSSKDALNAHGGGNISVIGSSDVIVDSSNAEAAITNGSGNAQVRAPAFRITGGYTQTGSSTFANPDGSTPANITTGVPPIPDPLAWLPYPSMPAAGTETITQMTGGGKLHTFTPGYYASNGNNPTISVSGQDAIYMQPGIYYLQGGLTYNGSGGLTANGVMIFNNGSDSQGITITGQGLVNMSPYNNPNGPTPWYDGILVFQSRTDAATIQVTGNGSYTVGGTFYAADALCKISGNGDSYIGSQYISRYLDLGGNGSLTINYNAAPHPHRRVMQLVE